MQIRLKLLKHNVKTLEAVLGSGQARSGEEGKRRLGH